MLDSVEETKVAIISIQATTPADNKLFRKQLERKKLYLVLEIIHKKTYFFKMAILIKTTPIRTKKPQ